MTLLSVHGLSVGYETRRGLFRAVDNISFEVRKGRPLGFVGESGCGKTTIGMTLMGLLPENAGILEGEMQFYGMDLARLSESQFRSVRGRKISMIFQAAMNALNPVMSVDEQIREALSAHFPKMSKKALDQRVASLCDLVELPRDRLRGYPHEFSGGMKQRAVIAMALACTPKLVVADEPTTALDVIVQEQILSSLRAIQARTRTGLILISHDIAVVASICDDVCVMYGGQIVEAGLLSEVFSCPGHPYTRLLLSSYLSLSSPRTPGGVPGLNRPPDLTLESGMCRYAPNCPDCDATCRTNPPRWVEMSSGHRVFCCKEKMVRRSHEPV